MSAKTAQIEATSSTDDTLDLGNGHVPVLLPTGEIKHEQDDMRKGQLSMDRRVHNNAIQCMLHAQKHGDISLMRRLLVDTLGNSGFRAQGLINWMRLYTPMELKGKDMNLSGTDGKGHRRQWRILEADANPFWTDPRNDEKVAKPVFQDTLLSPFQRGIKGILEAVENTVNGQPVNPKKPYFDGIYSDKLVDFAEKAKALIAEVPADDTVIVRRARAERARLDAVIEAGEKAIKEETKAA